MAETAKLMSPNKKVLLPDMKAGCSLSSSITGQDVRNLKKKWYSVRSLLGPTRKIYTNDGIFTHARALQLLSLAEDLESAFFHFYGKKIEVHEFLNFQTWVGGDRDGNPNVTFKISEFAVITLTNHLISMYNRDLDLLFNDYSISF